MTRENKAGLIVSSSFLLLLGAVLALKLRESPTGADVADGSAARVVPPLNVPGTTTPPAGTGDSKKETMATPKTLAVPGAHIQVGPPKPMPPLVPLNGSESSNTTVGNSAVVTAPVPIEQIQGKHPQSGKSDENPSMIQEANSLPAGNHGPISPESEKKKDPKGAPPVGPMVTNSTLSGPVPGAQSPEIQPGASLPPIGPDAKEETQGVIQADVKNNQGDKVRLTGGTGDIPPVGLPGGPAPLPGPPPIPVPAPLPQPSVPGAMPPAPLPGSMPPAPLPGAMPPAPLPGPLPSPNPAPAVQNPEVQLPGAGGQPPPAPLPEKTGNRPNPAQAGNLGAGSDRTEKMPGSGNGPPGGAAPLPQPVPPMPQEKVIPVRNDVVPPPPLPQGNPLVGGGPPPVTGLPVARRSDTPPEAPPAPMNPPLPQDGKAELKELPATPDKVGPPAKLPTPDQPPQPAPGVPPGLTFGKTEASSGGPLRKTKFTPEVAPQVGVSAANKISGSSQPATPSVPQENLMGKPSPIQTVDIRIEQKPQVPPQARPQPTSQPIPVPTPDSIGVPTPPVPSPIRSMSGTPRSHDDVPRGEILPPTRAPQGTRLYPTPVVGRVSRYTSQAMVAQLGDSWESVSQRHYGFDWANNALRNFNMTYAFSSARMQREGRLIPGESYHVPVVDVLRRNHGLPLDEPRH